MKQDTQADGTMAKAIAETANASMEFHAEQIAKQDKISKSQALAKYLAEADGASLYSDYTEAKLAKRDGADAKAQFGAVMTALAKANQEPGESKWDAMNKFLNTKLGRDLYRKASEVA